MDMIPGFAGVTPKSAVASRAAIEPTGTGAEATGELEHPTPAARRVAEMRLAAALTAALDPKKEKRRL